MLTMVNIEDGEKDRHIPEFTMKELSIAIDVSRKGTKRTAKESKRKISKD